MKSAVCLAVITLLLIGSLGDSRAQEPEKFSLTMFHFNVQYVAGGLKGFPSGSDNNPTFDLDDAQVQDLIIKESFEPVLDVRQVLGKNPYLKGNGSGCLTCPRANAPA